MRISDWSSDVCSSDLNHPESADGPYWLLTPELGAPQRFYCDMTTDGGGWVLVGRGRNGWTWDHAGTGTPEQIVDVPTGPNALPPATPPGDTLDALPCGPSVNRSDGRSGGKAGCSQCRIGG